MPRGNRFTIYDSMEKSGFFDSNPANAFSRSPVDGSALYQGPVPYPKMLYHPEGEQNITVPAELITTPFGPKAVGEQRETIYRIVQNASEDAAAAAEGWHDHPAKAMRARVQLVIAANSQLSENEKSKMLKVIPSLGSDEKIRQLEAELARLTKLKSEEEDKMEEVPPVAAQAKPVSVKPTVSASANL